MTAKEIAQNIDWTQACCKPMGKEQDLWDTEMSLKLEQQIIDYTKAKCKEQRSQCGVAYIMTSGNNIDEHIKEIENALEPSYE